MADTLQISLVEAFRVVGLRMRAHTNLGARMTRWHRGLGETPKLSNCALPGLRQPLFENVPCIVWPSHPRLKF
jgi:hypothetical protein